ncbi:snRNA-activating protein complex subunit 4 isoform X1 [Lagopus leucura]|uniref:snRNA-activating protein complex subunit 4 isoform X1 n=2 Tax=Lagopus leucura TaxID=30410 RepID=UPI001C687242|nr:snRNA-activating protein complex subunit 4 isoform X1 [Lagopus leucura]
MSRRNGPAGAELNAEREKIRREIEELERSLRLDVTGGDVAVSDSSLSSDDAEGDSSDVQAEMEVGREEDSSDDDLESSLLEDPETCLQMNYVYQEVIQEKIEEVELLIAQNKEQQKEILWELDGRKTARTGDGRNLPSNIFLGHFMKPYFKDKTTGIGPPSNEDAKEKAAQGIKSFEQLLSTKWKSKEKVLLQKSVVSDRLQRLLQPKLLKLSYSNQKLENVKTEMEKQILEKQIKEVEREIEAINQLPESDLLGDRFDEHDWEKISNIHFDGRRSSEELKKFWQNWEHPSINKNEWTEEETERLKDVAAKHGYLDWQTVAQELGTNRTAFQCLQKYQAYNKDLKRKEWTRDEDKMLLELVQEMRVGSHIPYKKIAYYMEGRDSAQLIYRWTKSVDPSLKKGPWTPEEDAMLLAAVEKYGERDWYKIRTEVPGRSDAQCSDRYLKALHRDVKKGKWSLQEEEQLIDLVQKHGLGHWSKIAAELPHRTRSQCLSKWKIMIGSKKRSRSVKRQHREESSSCSESSSEDVELDLSDTSEEEKTSKEECTFPSIDLWIPTQADVPESCQGRHQNSSPFSFGSVNARTSSSKIPHARCEGAEEGVTNKATELSTILRGLARPHSTDITVKNPIEEINKASRCGKQVLRVTLEDVRRVLRENTCFQRRLQSKLTMSAAALAKTSGVGASAAEKHRGLWNTVGKTRCQERARWRKMNLDRKLLMAVTPWVGDVLLPCTSRTGKMAFDQTKAYSIQQKLKSVSLSSTPLFTLFIQLFRIDTNGCMKIIRERRADAVRPQQASQNSESSSGDATQPAPKRQTAPPVVPSLLAPLAQAQRQKPKTVSELLREKRQMEKQLKEKAVQTKVFVAPQVMLSGPLIIQHPPQPMIPSAQVESKPGAVGSTASHVQHVPAASSAFTSVAGSASTPVVLENHSPSVSKAGESPRSSQETKVQSSKELNEQAPQNTPERGVFPSLNPGAAGKAPDQGGCSSQVLAGSSAPVVLQNQAFVPHRVTVVPFGIESGNSKLSLPTPVTYELNRPGPVNLLPALLAPQPGSRLTPDSVLPLTWIVTQQALLSSAVQAVVGVPQGLQAAIVRSQSQASVTSSGNVCGLGAPPASSGVNMPQPSHAETKTNPQLASGSPAGKTAGVSHSASVFPVSSASPACSISGVSSATSAHSDGSSKAVDPSAAQNAPPGGAPTPHAQLLPQMQPPASTQGSDSHCVTGAVSLGENQDSSTNGSSSNSNVLNKGVVLQPGASIPHDSVAGNPEGSAEQALKYRPIASKPPPAQAASAPPQPTTSSAEKTLLDYSLISFEDEELVKEWLSGKQGVQVPPLQTRLPYFPPFLCNLKTLSKLLLQKAALEKQAARLLSPDGSQTEGEVDLNAITELVHEKLGDDPAFLLLKARFLAAFTLPAVLATLPPPKVATTLSASRREYGESDEEEWQSEEEASEDESGGDELDARSDGAGGDEPGDRDADFPDKGMETEEIAAQSIVGTCTDGTASIPQIRRSLRIRKRFRKRRRL